jgi:hypothetical protein
MDMSLAYSNQIINVTFVGLCLSPNSSLPQPTPTPDHSQSIPASIKDIDSCDINIVSIESGNGGGCCLSNKLNIVPYIHLHTALRPLVVSVVIDK